jgi:cell fate regulator YaaT (PSP1 superfamily)
MNETNSNTANNKKKFKDKDRDSENVKEKENRPNNQNNPGNKNKYNKYNRYNKKRGKKSDTPDASANIKEKIIEKLNEKLNENGHGNGNGNGNEDARADAKPGFEIEDIIIPEEETADLPEPPSAAAEPEAAGPMIEIVGIRFKPVGKIYYFSPDGVQYYPNEKIIVETSRGLELGYIVIPNKNISAGKVVQPLKQVLRKASEDDAKRADKNKAAAKETIKIANDRIKFHNLNSMKMKLVEAEYTFDNSKLIYYFTADGRVDFRDLVKDLAAIFKTRIEMRQIGIRDQTKILGGLSICGRPFCCNSFLQDFAQVTIKMAKEQNMSINSSKISGACGRLMCCLKYEHEAYDHLSKDTPKINSIVEVSTGETGIVTESNLLTGVCKVRINPRNGADGVNVIKPFPKKNLKIIGFMKNEQEHLYDKGEK